MSAVVLEKALKPFGVRLWLALRALTVRIQRHVQVRETLCSELLA